MVHPTASDATRADKVPEKRDSGAPNSIPWPPLIFVAAAAAAVAMNLIHPLDEPRPPSLRATGFAVLAAGAALDCSAMITMRRNHANILPHRAATNLVTTGPFSVSRNPIYLGNTVMLLGAAAAFANLWFVALAPCAAFAVTHLAIRREERHMDRTFGAAWRDYARRVPRWLLWR
jgi:protein-S-isoprenylcysteine O-methyltransferase Ste14